MIKLSGRPGVYAKGRMKISELKIRELKLLKTKGRYWQIAKHGFLFECNNIKMRCSNTVSYVCLRSFVENWVQFSSTPLVLDTFVCAQH